MDDLEHFEVLEGVEELDGEPADEVVVESLGSESTKSKGRGDGPPFTWHGSLTLLLTLKSLIFKNSNRFMLISSNPMHRCFRKTT